MTDKSLTETLMIITEIENTLKMIERDKFMKDKTMIGMEETMNLTTKECILTE
jgi:hypothetical protein